MRSYRYALRVAVLLLAVAGISIAQLSGTKTVGSGGTYATIAAAIADLNANGVNGPVVFSLTDAAYAETGANLWIHVSTSAPTAANTVTFKPAPGVSPVITVSGCTNSGTNIYSAFTISDNSYITIDGSNAPGGTSKDLTLTMNDATNGRNLIYLSGNCDNIVIKNCRLTVASIFTGSAANPTQGISVLGTAVGVADNLTIQNNQIFDGVTMATYGITVQGYVAGSLACTNIAVKDNVISSQWRSVHYYFVGSTGNSSEISGNQISAASNAGGFNVYALYLRTNGGTINIFNNKFAALKLYTTSGSSVLYGIATTSSVAGTVVNIYNNFMSEFYSMLATGGGAYGIYLGPSADVGSYNILHNTIVMAPVNNLTTTVAAIRVSSTVNAAIKNNIIVNSFDMAGSYGIYQTNSGTFTSDYNDISISTANGNVGFAATARKTLADWQGGWSQDANSKSVPVAFVSATDLHLSGGSAGDHNLMGTPGTGVATDIDGETRSASSPYMGADEYAASPLPVELSAFRGVATERGIELTWTTATEVNNAGFAVERLAGDGQWTKMAFVAGHGTSNVSNTYRYVDASPAAGTVSYRLKQIDRDGRFTYTQAVEVAAGAMISTYALEGNYPNPFNPATLIAYQLPSASRVTLKVLDILGREVALLVDRVQPAGKYSVRFDASRLPSGLYFCSMQAAGFSAAKKMLLVK